MKQVCQTSRKFLIVSLLLIVGLLASSGYGRLLSDGELNPFEKVRQSIVTITSKEGKGTGFIVRMDDDYWLMSNEHVIGKSSCSFAELLTGEKIALTNEVQFAKSKDIVRFKLDKVYPALSWRATAPKMNESLWVFGNSKGSDVLTNLRGEVVGIGRGKIEISAHIVSGNSGSPVVDKNGDVIGIATYATQESSEDWVSRGTRFSDVRRFALTLDDVEWMSSNYPEFVLEYNKRMKFFGEALEIVKMCDGHITSMDGLSEGENSRHMMSMSKGFGGRGSTWRVGCDKNPWIVVYNSSSEAKDRFKPKNKVVAQVFRKINATDAYYNKKVDSLQCELDDFRPNSGRIGGPSSTSIARRYKEVGEASSKCVRERIDALKIILKAGKKATSQLEIINELNTKFCEIVDMCIKKQVELRDAAKKKNLDYEQNRGL